MKIECISERIKASADRVLAYRTLSETDKEQFILELLADNRSDFLPNALAHLSDIFTVKQRNGKTFVEYNMSNAAYRQIQQQSRELQDSEQQDKDVDIRQQAFHDEKENIDKISNAKVANFFLSGLPLLNETKFPDGREFSTNETVNANQATQLIWTLMQNYPYHTNTVNDLRNFLKSALSNTTITDKDKKIVLSLYKHLFSDTSIKVTGDGFNTAYRSFYHQSSNATNPEIRQRNAEILNLFLSYFNSVRKSNLVYTNDQFSFVPDESVYNDVKNRMNKALFLNLFTTQLGDDENTQQIVLNPSIGEGLYNAGVQFKKQELGYEVHFKGTVLPFSLSSQGRESLAISNTTIEPELIVDLLKTAGYNENVVDPQLLKDYVSRGTAEEQRAYNMQMANLGISSLLLAAYNEELNEKSTGLFDKDFPVFGKTGTNKNLKNNTYSSLSELMQAKYGNENSSPLNHRMLIEKIFPGYNVNLNSTFVYSPTMFFIGNENLAKYIVERNNIMESRVAPNVKGDNVGVYAVQSNVFKLQKTISEVAKLPVSAFKSNPFVKGIARLGRTLILNGYKQEFRSKDHMDMDAFEFNTTVKRFFVDSLIDNYIEGNGVSKLMLPIHVFSDKSAFALNEVNILQSGYNPFPLVDGKKGKQLDVAQLLDRSIKQFEEKRQHELQQFVIAWHGIIPDLNAYHPAIVNDPGKITKLTSILATGNLNSLQQWLQENKIMTKGTPWSLTANYHYDPKSAHLSIRKEVLDYFTKSSKQYGQELLTKLATSHNLNLEIGFQASERQQAFFNELRLQTGSEQRIEGANSIKAVQENVHPVDAAYFFAYNQFSRPAAELLFGSEYQYKGVDQNARMTDMLKRAIQAVAPYHIMAVDNTGKQSYTLPEKSVTIHVIDPMIERNLINGKEEKEAYDGYAVLNPLATKFIQSSMGGLHGVFPKSMLKLINLDMDYTNGIAQIYKYAAKDYSAAMYNMGTDQSRHNFNVLMDTVPFGVTQPIDVVIGDKPFTFQVQPQHTMKTLLDAFVNQLGGSYFERMDDLYQLINTVQDAQGQLPLRDKYVDQLVYGSSIKTGQKNMFTEQQLLQIHSDNKALLLDKLNPISNTRRGIQLDAIHDPEHLGISLISQAITNSVLEGWTFDESDKVFQVLSQITKEGNAEVFKNLNGGELQSEEEKNKFIRQLMVNALEAQGDYSDIYQIYQQFPNESFKENPQIIKKIVSAITSNVNKNTVNPQLTGGHFVLAPAQNFFQVYEMQKEGEEGTVVVTKDRVAKLSTEGYKQVTTRDLNWKGYVHKDGRNLFELPEWQQYTEVFNEYKQVASKADATQLGQVQELKKKAVELRGKVQELLMDPEWSITPAEFILPNVFKKQFGLHSGVQVSDLNQNYFFEQVKRQLVYESIKKENLKLANYLKRIGELQDTDYDEIMAVTGEDVDKKFNELLTNEVWDEEQQTGFLESLHKLAEIKTENFKKSLDIIVNRIPLTGMQSMVHGKVVGFAEGDYNLMYVPVELLMIQGADFDIDKAAVLFRTFEKDGHLAENGVNGLLNQLFDSMHKVISNPKNALQSDTAVALTQANLIKTEMESSVSEEQRFDPAIPEHQVLMKQLAAEGKVMVGIFANGLKTYGLVYYTRKKLGKEFQLLKPLQFVDSKGQVQEYKDIAGDEAMVDYQQGKDQGWKFYSELVNAATDNAKELILGAIKANKQTGNLINAAVLYGVEANELFRLFNEPFVLQVLKQLQANTQLYKDYTQFKSFKDIVTEVSLGLTQEQMPRFNTFVNLYKAGEEFGVLAAALSINRALPVSMYDKFTYNRRLDKFINDAQIEEDSIKGFELRDFVNGFGDNYELDNDYVKQWEREFGARSNSVNILSVLRTVPTIRENLKTKMHLDDYLRNELPVYRLTEQLLPKDASVTDEQYERLTNYVNNLWVSDYLDKQVKQQVVYASDGDSTNFDMSTPIGVNRFVQMLPLYLDVIKNMSVQEAYDKLPQEKELIDNWLNKVFEFTGKRLSGNDKINQLENNKFFATLQNTANENGSFLYIPNIDVLTEGEQQDLKFHFASNNGLGSSAPIFTPGKVLDYGQLKRMVLNYTLVTSKGRIGKFSFIDLIDVNTRMPYLRFLQKGLSVSTGQINRVAVARINKNSLTSINKVLENEKRSSKDSNDQVFVPISKNVEELPPFVKKFNRSGYQVMQLVQGDNGQFSYTRVVPVFDTISLSENVSGINEYALATDKRFKINNPQEYRRLLSGSKITDAYFKEGVPAAFEALTNAGRVIVTKEGKNRYVQLKESRRSFITSAISKKVTSNIVNILSQHFVDVPVKQLNSEEIADQYGKNFSTKAAFVLNNEIVFNTDEFGLDTPIHEFAHIMLANLKERNPESYNRVTSLALQSEDAIANRVRELYPELKDAELGEEIFVTLLGVEGIKSLQQKPTAFNTSLLNMVQRIYSNLKDYVATLFSKNGRKNIEPLDFSQATLHEVLLALGEDLVTALDHNLSAEEKSFIGDATLLDPEVEKIADPSIKFSKAALLKHQLKLSNIGALFNVFTNSEYLQGFNNETGAQISKEVVDYMNDVVKGNEERRLYKREPWMKHVDALMVDFNPASDKVFTMSAALRTGDFKGVNVGNLPIDHMVVVKREVGNGEVQYTLINLSPKNLSTRYNTSNNRTTIAGAFIDDSEAKYKGIDLGNDQHGNTMFLNGLLGMKIKQKLGNKVKFGNMYSLYYKGDTNALSGEFFDRIVDNVAGVASLDRLQDSVTGELKELLSNKQLMDGDTYRSKKMEYYKTFVKSVIQNDEAYGTTKQFYSSILDELNKTKDLQELKKFFNNRLMKLIRRHSEESSTPIYKEGGWNGQEVRIISDVLTELNNIEDIYKERFDVTKFRSFINNPAKSASVLFEKLYTTITNGIHVIRRKFFESYKPSMEKAVKELMDEHNKTNPSAYLQQITLGNASELFHPMYEQVEAQDESGNKVMVYTGRLWQHGQKEHAALTPAQKSFIAHVGNLNAEYIKPHLGKEEDVKSFVPLMKEDAFNIFTHKVKQGKYREAFSQSFDRWWNSTVNNADYFVSNEDLSRKEIFLKLEYGYYNSKETKYGSLARLSSIGLTQNKRGALVVTDPSKNSNFEKNLEYSMNFMVMNSLYKTELEKEALPMYHVAKSYLTVAESQFGKDVTGIQQMLDDYVTRLMYNLNNKTKGFETPEKISNGIMGVLSSSVMGLNIFSDTKNFLGQMIVGQSAAMKNYFINKFGADDLFTTIDFNKACGELFSKSNWDKVNAMMQEYGLTHMDYDSMLSQRNNITGQKLLKHENLFWLNYRGDKFNRAAMFVAQMIHDGSWQAYSMKENKLAYDEDKDPRFKGEKGESLKTALKAALKTEEGGIKNGKMQRGYDNNIVNKLKVLSDDMYGSYDKQTANNLNNYWLGRAFSSFHKYLWNKVQQYTDSTAFNKVNGRYVTKEVNGRRVTVWEGSINEGIFQTMRFLINQSIKNRNIAWGDLDPAQKRNMAALTSDVVAFSMLTYLFTAIAGALFDDEEDEWKNTTYGKLLDYSLRDAFPVLDGRTYNLLREPFVVTSWTSDLISNTYKYLTKGDERAGQAVLRNGPGIGIPWKMYETIEQFNPDDYDFE